MSDETSDEYERRDVLKQLSGSAVATAGLASTAAGDTGTAEWSSEVELAQQRIDTELFPEFENHLVESAGDVLTTLSDLDEIPGFDVPELSELSDTTRFFSHPEGPDGSVQIDVGIRGSVGDTRVEIRGPVDSHRDQYAVVQPADGEQFVVTPDGIEASACLEGYGCEPVRELLAGGGTRTFCRQADYNCCNCYVSTDNPLCECSCAECGTTCAEVCP